MDITNSDTQTAFEAKMATGKFSIGCWWFWSNVYWKTIYRSSHRIHQKILLCGYWLGRWPLMWNKTILELWSAKKRRPLHAKVCLQWPPWIPTLISKRTPTFTTQMGTPKLWTNNRMGQREKLIIYPTRTEAVEPTLLVALGSVALYPLKVTTKTEDTVHQFLDYCATHPNEKYTITPDTWYW